MTWEPGDVFRVKGLRGKFKVQRLVDSGLRATIYATDLKRLTYKFFYTDDERLRKEKKR